MKLYRKILACLTAGAVCLSLTGCSTGNAYFDTAGSFIERTVSLFSEEAGSRMKDFSEWFSKAPKDGDWETYFEEFYNYYNSEAVNDFPPDIEQDNETADSQKPVNDSGSGRDDGQKPSGSDNKKPSDTESQQTSGAEEKDPAKPESLETSQSSSEQSAGADNGSGAASYIDSEYVPEYEHYDKEKFFALCDEMVEAGKASDAGKTGELYDQLIEELRLIATMDTVAFLNYSTNVNDEYYDEEYSYVEQAYTDCYDRFMVSCREVMESKGGDAFEEHADESIVEEAEDYEAMTDETKALLDRETELESDYDKALDAVGDITYTLKGKTYTFDQLYEDASSLTMLAMYNYNDFLKVYEGLLKAANESIGPIFIELLQVRKELAAAFGYDSYADYCYENVFGRTYTTKDAEEFCNNIKKNIGSRYYGSGASNYIYNSSYFETEFTLDEIFDIADDFTKGFDSEINDSFHELLDKKLYDIGAGDGRYAGSYTSIIYTEGLPFIFINSENNVECLSTLEHEFGHFTNSLYEEKDPDSFYRDDNYDVMEIHSNSMQLLCSNHYGEILDYDEALLAVQFEVAFQLSSVLDGCIYDEFQRIVYENPDMTLDELNDLYKNICLEYGQTSTPGNEYMWIFVNHTFESPMYYISYAVSALSALEIWQISRTAGEAKAVEIWLNLMHEKDDEDYETVLKNAGLTPFTDSEAAVKIISDAIDELLSSDLVIRPLEAAA